MNGWRWALVALLLLLLQLLLLGVETTKKKSKSNDSNEFVLVCDAGSSGTRFYLFSKDAVANDLPSSALLKLDTVALQEQTPETVFGYARPGLTKALESVPEGATIDWYLYGTAGMRLVPESLQNDLYASLKEGVASLDNDDNHKRLIAREMRTLRGDEEGFFAALAVNYLAGKLTKNLRPLSNSNSFKSELYGALDLGGSSTQLIYAKDDDLSSTTTSNLRINNDNDKHPPPLSQEDFFVHSYSNYGANRMRENLLERWAEQTTSTASVWQHPCLFRGDTMSINGRSWEGSGKGRDCIDFIESVVAESNRDCPKEQQEPPEAPNAIGCALDSVPQPPPSPGTKFYAFSVYYYAMQFAHDVTSHYYSNSSVSEGTSSTPKPLTLPNPTLNDLERTTEWICGLEADKVHLSATQLSSLTPTEQVYRRCFDLAYIVVLMRRFRVAAKEEDNANVYFVFEIDGHKVSWTIGAYLYIMAREETEKQPSVAARTMTSRLVRWICGGALAILVGMRYRHKMCSWFRAFRFPKDAND